LRRALISAVVQMALCSWPAPTSPTEGARRGERSNRMGTRLTFEPSCTCQRTRHSARSALMRSRRQRRDRATVTAPTDHLRIRMPGRALQRVPPPPRAGRDSRRSRRGTSRPRVSDMCQHDMRSWDEQVGEAEATAQVPQEVQHLLLDVASIARPLMRPIRLGRNASGPPMPMVAALSPGYACDTAVRIMT